MPLNCLIKLDKNLTRMYQFLQNDYTLWQKKFLRDNIFFTNYTKTANIFFYQWPESRIFKNGNYEGQPRNVSRRRNSGNVTQS